MLKKVLMIFIFICLVVCGSANAQDFEEGSSRSAWNNQYPDRQTGLPPIREPLRSPFDQNSGRQMSGRTDQKSGQGFQSQTFQRNFQPQDKSKDVFSAPGARDLMRQNQPKPPEPPRINNVRDSLNFFQSMRDQRLREYVDQKRIQEMVLMQQQHQQQFGGQGMPGQPSQPGQPGQFGQPGQPGQPGKFGQPGQPGQPGQFGQPGQPGKFGQPGQPGQPGQFGQSGQPGKFGQPGQIGQFGQPGQPGRPGQPGQPGQPGYIGPTRVNDQDNQRSRDELQRVQNELRIINEEILIVRSQIERIQKILQQTNQGNANRVMMARVMMLRRQQTDLPPQPTNQIAPTSPTRPTDPINPTGTSPTGAPTYTVPPPSYPAGVKPPPPPPTNNPPRQPIQGGTFTPTGTTSEDLTIEQMRGRMRAAQERLKALQEQQQKLMQRLNELRNRMR